MMDLKDTLKKIGLLYSSEHLDDLVDSATQKRFGPHQLLEYLCELELRDRTRRSLERRMQHSRLGRFKTMADFDWKWPDKIDPRGGTKRVITRVFIPATQPHSGRLAGAWKNHDR